jgi:hypothetical protein
MPSQTRRALEDYDNQHDFERMALHDAWYLGKQLMQQIIQRGMLCVYVTFLVELASLSEATVSMVSTVDPKDPVLRTFKIARTPADGLGYAAALTQDLELDALFRAMAVGDKYLLEVAQKAVLTSLEEPAAILNRQHILADCLERPEIVRQMYANAVEAIEGEKKIWGCTTQRQYPEMTLHRAVEALKLFVGLLKRLRHIADEQGAIFRSEGFTAPFGTLAKELDDEYLSIVADHLRRLAFGDGILMSAELGQGNKGTHYKREEDATMRSGKAQRSRGKLSGRWWKQVSKVFYVTHMFDLAHGFYLAKTDTALFLRAERLADGGRTFRLEEGEPLPTSYGEDLYRRIFGAVPDAAMEALAA